MKAPPTSRLPDLRRPFGYGALVLAAAAAVILGVRTISSVDIGYHLADGERTLRTGQVTSTVPQVYTVPPAESAGPLPPGCWYDGQGRFRFPNANWLSQVLFAMVHTRAGLGGLSILAAVCVAGIVLAAGITLHKLGAPPTAVAAGLVLLAITAQERLNLRPELLGYLLLAVMAALQLPPARRNEPVGWGRLALLVALQVVLVNLHSYWMLALAITLCVLVDAVARRAVAAPDDLPTASRRWRRAAILLGAQLGGCFINPFTWRLVALPVQTLLFFRRHGITKLSILQGGHPWGSIGEFFSPFEPGFSATPATWAFYIVLVLAAGGVVVAIIHRRWAEVLLLGGMTAVSLSMRRNIAPAAILIVPVAMGNLSAAVAAWSRRKPLLAGPAVTIPAALAVGVVSAVVIGSVVSQRFYFRQRRPERFGLGANRLVLPLYAADWLSGQTPAGRLWCGYDESSNLYYFTRYPAATDDGVAHPAVPVLTNTWAYPPDVLRMVLDVLRGVERFEPVAHRYGVEVVAMRIGRLTAEPTGPHLVPLGLKLSAEAAWTLVHLDGAHAIWLRAEGPNRDLARRLAVRPEQFDTTGYVAALRELDPVEGYALYQGGRTLSLLGWNAHAVEVLAEAVRAEPAFTEAWYEMGVCYARLASADHAMDTFRQAITCFQRALSIDPDFTPARQQLKRVQAEMQRYRRADAVLQR